MINDRYPLFPSEKWQRERDQEVDRWMATLPDVPTTPERSSEPENNATDQETVTMKTNVSVDLDDAARSRLADLLDGKATKRLATRAEIGALCRAGLDALLGDQDAPPRPDPVAPPVRKTVTADDEAVLAGKSESYRRGWDQAGAVITAARKAR
jgi:hypothetical protein